jgi:hypothetical protein
LYKKNKALPLPAQVFHHTLNLVPLPFISKISSGMKLLDKNRTGFQGEYLSMKNSLAIIDASAFGSVWCPIKRGTLHGA